MEKLMQEYREKVENLFPGALVDITCSVHHFRRNGLIWSLRVYSGDSIRCECCNNPVAKFDYHVTSAYTFGKALAEIIAQSGSAS